MGAGGLSKRLLNLADEIVGGLYGGIGLTAVVTCMFFGAISGSGPATVAAIGALTIPAMIERGYDKFFSAALVAAAGCVARPRSRPATPSWSTALPRRSPSATCSWAVSSPAS